MIFYSLSLVRWWTADLEQVPDTVLILTPLHNINRQNVKANKFILGRLGENQP